MVADVFGYLAIDDGNLVRHVLFVKTSTPISEIISIRRSRFYVSLSISYRKRNGRIGVYTVGAPKDMYAFLRDLQAMNEGIELPRRAV